MDDNRAEQVIRKKIADMSDEVLADGLIALARDNEENNLLGTIANFLMIEAAQRIRVNGENDG